MDNPTSKKLEIIIPAYRMHTQQFNNALDGISEEQALKRIEDKTNHVIWMVGNFVDCRYWLANTLGIADENPHSAFFKDAKAIDASLKYPSVEELKTEFHKISPIVYQKLLTTTDEELSDAVEFGMGVSFVEENKLNMVGMAIGREDYLLGQLGLMRKILGLAGVKYDVDESVKY